MASIEAGNILLDSAKGSDITKQDIREKVWEHFENNGISANPIPVKNRIPNFKTSVEACDNFAKLEMYTKAKIIKVNPDKPQQQIRFRILEDGKTLLVPTPRLANGLFNKIKPPENANKKDLRTCASSFGVKRFKEQIGLDTDFKLDLLIVGSVAVSPNGVRIGRGEGFADLEYALLGQVGAITPETIIVTIVHESQVINLPETLEKEHDFGVDVIVTPTQVIHVKPTKKRPVAAIDWSILQVQRYRSINILKQLRQKEKEANKVVKLADQGEIDPDDEQVEENKENFDKPPRKRYGSRKFYGRKNGPRNNRSRALSENENTNAKMVNGGEIVQSKEKARKPRQRPRTRSGGENRKPTDENVRRSARSPNKQKPMFAIWVGRISRTVRVSELKAKIRECGVQPIHVVWRPQTRSAFLLLLEASETEEAVNKLNGFEISGCKPVVEMSRRTKQRLTENDVDQKAEAVH